MRTALRHNRASYHYSTATLPSQGESAFIFKEDLGRHENRTHTPKWHPKHGPRAQTCRYLGVLSQAELLCQHMWLAVLRGWLAYPSPRNPSLIPDTLIWYPHDMVHLPLVLEKIIGNACTDIFILIVMYILPCV